MRSALCCGQNYPPLMNNLLSDYRCLGAKVLRCFGESVKDAVFPAFCFGCEKEGVYLCEACLLKIEAGGAWFCPACHSPEVAGRPCPSCQKRSWLSRHVAVTAYAEEGIIGRIIHAWKYRYVEEIEDSISALINKFVTARPEVFFHMEAIIPVPLHPRRCAERGFNQAERISAILAHELNIPVAPMLLRERYTKQQARLSKEERQDNVRGAFALSARAERFSRVLVVDDVYTTGSTMQECARILAEHGARSISGFTLARG